MLGWHQNWGLKVPWDESGGVSVMLARRCPAWRRREPGLLRLRETGEGVLVL